MYAVLPPPDTDRANTGNRPATRGDLGWRAGHKVRRRSVLVGSLDGSRPAARGGSGWRAEHIVRRSSLWFGSSLESPVQSSQRQTRGATKGATSGVALGPLEPHQHDCPRDHPYRSYRPADRDVLRLDRIWPPLREPEREGLQGRAAFRGSARRASVRSSCELLCTHPVTSAPPPKQDDGPPIASGRSDCGRVLPVKPM